MGIFTRFSLKNTLVIFLIILILIGGGIYSGGTVKQEMMPNIDIPFLRIVTVYPGATPEDISNDISNPLQKAVSGIQGLKEVNASSNENISFIMLNFDYSKKMDKAKTEVQDAINKVKLPDKAQKPEVLTFSYASIPVVSYSVTADMDENELLAVMKDEIQPAISGIKGVGSVALRGIENKNIFIKVNAEKLKANNLTMETLQQMLAANDLTYPVGTVQETDKSLPLKVSRKITSTKDLEMIPVAVVPVGQPGVSSNPGRTQNLQQAAPDMKVVYLKDVAEITLEKPVGLSITRTNLKPTILFTVYKNEDANAVVIEKSVREKIDELSAKYPKIKLEKIDDSARYITDSINGMVREGLLGALFAIIIIALFLRDLRATVIAVISIPLSILIALILMPRFGISLNMMSLSGMAVAIGRIVDDSIVVIENIYRRLTRTHEANTNLIEDATGEVSSAITSSTITTVAVFLPLTFVNGMVGKIFQSFAFTVVICILASLLVAITVVPIMSKFTLLKRPPKHKKEVSKIEEGYRKVLNFALGHRALVLICAVVLLISSFLLVSRVGVKFLPADKTNIINATLNLPSGSSLESTEKEARKFEEYLLSNKDVNMVTSQIGDNSGTDEAAYGMIQGSNQATMTIVLKDKADNTKALKEITEKAKSFESKDVTWMVKPLDHYSEGERFEVVITGKNFDDMKAAADLIKAKIKEVPEAYNVTNNMSEKKPEIVVTVDSEKAIKAGLNPALVALQIRSMMNFDKVSTVENDGKSVNVMMGFSKADIDSKEKVQNLQISGMTGALVSVKDIADVEIKDGPISISEKDGKRYASVSADLNSDNTMKVTADIDKKIKEIKSQFKEGVEYKIGGSSEDITETFTQMAIAMILAVFLVFITLVLAFKEGTAPLSILFSLPFAAVGALLALVITNHPISMSGLVGLLMLIGIVVTNAIVLVDRAQSNRRKGMKIKEALLEAGAIRLRPIIMTAVATIMALIPLAAGLSEGAIISEELGIVVIGGLAMSTVLTLVVVPVMFSLLEGLKMKIFKEKDAGVNTPSIQV